MMQRTNNIKKKKRREPISANILSELDFAVCILLSGGGRGHLGLFLGRWVGSLVQIATIEQRRKKKKKQSYLSVSVSLLVLLFFLYSFNYTYLVLYGLS